MNTSRSDLNQFLNPDILREKLILISLFIAVYENFKSTIVNNVKYFYWSGFVNGKELFDNYEEHVLNLVKSKKNRQIKATVIWLKQVGAITEEDEQNLIKLTNMRNILVHDMSNILFGTFPEDLPEIYSIMLNLYDKVTRWWICEIEIPTNPDISPEQYDNICWDKVTSLNIEFLKIITDVAVNSADKYQQMYNEIKKEN